jgi:hypothetical protein
MINRAISVVLCSYATVRGRYVPPYNAYRDEVDTEYVVLTNIHLKDVYNMVFILIGVAVLCFIGENIYYQSRWRWYSLEEEEQGKWKIRFYLKYIQRICESFWHRDIKL